MYIYIFIYIYIYIYMHTCKGTCMVYTNCNVDAKHIYIYIYICMYIYIHGMGLCTSRAINGQ